MDAEGFVHEGVTISNSRSPFRVDFKALVGRVVMVYGQTEIQKDLYDSGARAQWPIVFEAEGVQLHDLTTDAAVRHLRGARRAVDRRGRLHRRLRRVPRCQPALHPRRREARVRAAVPLRVDGSALGNPTGQSRVDLRPPPAGLCAVLDAQSDAFGTGAMRASTCRPAVRRESSPPMPTLRPRCSPTKVSSPRRHSTRQTARRRRSRSRARRRCSTRAISSPSSSG